MKNLKKYFVVKTATTQVVVKCLHSVQMQRKYKIQYHSKQLSRTIAMVISITSTLQSYIAVEPDFGAFVKSWNIYKTCNCQYSDYTSSNNIFMQCTSAKNIKSSNILNSITATLQSMRNTSSTLCGRSPSLSRLARDAWAASDSQLPVWWWHPSHWMLSCTVLGADTAWICLFCTRGILQSNAIRNCGRDASSCPVVVPSSRLFLDRPIFNL